MAAATLMSFIVGWPKRSLVWERYYPFGWAAVSAVMCWWLGLDFADVPSHLLSATVTFGAISSGFVGTSLAILTSLGTPVMRKIRQTPYVRVLRQYLGWALTSGIVLSCVSILGLFLHATSSYFAMAWWVALTFCIACLFRLAGTMLFVFSDPENVVDG